MIGRSIEDITPIWRDLLFGALMTLAKVRAGQTKLSLEVTSASVRVDVTMETEVAEVLDRLTAALPTALNATNALGIPVESDPEISQTVKIVFVQAPSPPPPLRPPPAPPSPPPLLPEAPPTVHSPPPPRGRPGMPFSGNGTIRSALTATSASASGMPMAGGAGAAVVILLLVLYCRRRRGKASAKRRAAEAKTAADAETQKGDQKPPPNLAPFTGAEDAALVRGVEEHGIGNWTAICEIEEVLHMRTADSLRTRYQQLLASGATRRASVVDVGTANDGAANDGAANDAAANDAAANESAAKESAAELAAKAREGVPSLPLTSRMSQEKLTKMHYNDDGSEGSRKLRKRSCMVDDDDHMRTSRERPESSRRGRDGPQSSSRPHDVPELRMPVVAEDEVAQLADDRQSTSRPEKSFRRMSDVASNPLTGSGRFRKRSCMVEDDDWMQTARDRPETARTRGGAGGGGKWKTALDTISTLADVTLHPEARTGLHDEKFRDRKQSVLCAGPAHSPCAMGAAAGRDRRRSHLGCDDAYQVSRPMRASRRRGEQVIVEEGQGRRGGGKHRKQSILSAMFKRKGEEEASGEKSFEGVVAAALHAARAGQEHRPSRIQMQRDNVREGCNLPGMTTLPAPGVFGDGKSNGDRRGSLAQMARQDPHLPPSNVLPAPALPSLPLSETAVPQAARRGSLLPRRGSVMAPNPRSRSGSMPPTARERSGSILSGAPRRAGCLCGAAEEAIAAAGLGMDTVAEETAAPPQPNGAAQPRRGSMEFRDLALAHLEEAGRLQEQAHQLKQPRVGGAPPPRPRAGSVFSGPATTPAPLCRPRSGSCCAMPSRRRAGSVCAASAPPAERGGAKHEEHSCRRGSIIEDKTAIRRQQMMMREAAGDVPSDVIPEMRRVRGVGVVRAADAGSRRQRRSGAADPVFL